MSHKHDDKTHGVAAPPPYRVTQATWNADRTTLTLEYDSPVVPEVYGPEPFNPAEAIMQDWRPAWQRAIALAWSSDELQSELLANPGAFLAKHCDYVMPITVNIVVMKDVESEWRPAPKGNPKQLFEWKLTRSTLVLHLPRAPEDVKQGPIALAAYESTGMTYPFTVCC